MFWYLTKPEERPRKLLIEIARQVETGEFEKLPVENQRKVTQQVKFWNQSQGKYLYDPNDKAYWWFLQPHWIKGIRGGNQSGKSATCILDLDMQMEDWHPLQRKNMERIIEETWDVRVKKWLTMLYERRIFYANAPVAMRCVGVDYPFIERVVGPEFEKWSSADMIEDVGYSHEKKRKITYTNGSYCEFMTHEQSAIQHAGAKLDGIYCDEELPKALWEQSKLRVSSKNGRLTLGMTAEKGITWTDSEVWKPGLTHKHKSIYAEEFSTYDNPVQTQEMVDKIKESCKSDIEIGIRIYGHSTPRGGRVYGMAQESEPWIIPAFEIPKDSGHLFMAIDVHGKLPHAVLWQWVDYEGLFHPLFTDKNGIEHPNIYNVAEVWETCNIPTLADFIREKEQYELKRKHDFAICDPYAWNTDQNNPKTIADQLIEAGLMISKATKDRDAGIQLVRTMLSLEIGRVLPEDSPDVTVQVRDYPQLMTFDHLTELIGERRKYRWKEPRQRFHDDVAVQQKPVDKDDHFMENEYRICLMVVNGEFTISQFDIDEYHHPGEKEP